MKAENLQGKTVLVTAGPTREYLDPVRYLSNPSTGRMGYTLAQEAAARGARVILISGPVSLAAPRGVQVVPVVSAQDMQRAVKTAIKQAHVLFMAAAVADQRPKVYFKHKVKKRAGEETLQLVRTPDILQELVRHYARKKTRPVLVGFCAETEKLVAHAQAKLKRKPVDVLVANWVGRHGSGFSATRDRGYFLQPGQKPQAFDCTKRQLARKIIERVKALL